MIIENVHKFKSKFVQIIENSKKFFAIYDDDEIEILNDTSFLNIVIDFISQ